MSRRTLAWTAAGFAVLFATSSAWAPPPAGGGGRPVGGGSSGGRPIGGTTGGSGGRPAGGTAGRPTTGTTGAAGKAAKADFAREFEAARTRSATDAAKVLRDRGSSALSRPERAAMLSAVAFQVIRQQRQEQVAAEQRLASLRLLRADWVAVGPGAGLDPLVELELAAAEAAAEQLALARAFSLVEDKQYAAAAGALVPLLDSRHLPAAVARAVPGLRTNLFQLVAALDLNPAGELPSLIAVDNTPYAVKLAVTRVEAARTVANLLAAELPQRPSMWWTPGNVTSFFGPLEKHFGPDVAAKVRAELSATAFLAGETEKAIEMLDGEVHPEHARQVLADLRAITLGGGTLENPQVAKSVVAGTLPAPLEPLVPGNLRAKWKAPTLPAEPTTLAKLEASARKDVAAAIADEVERLTAKVDEAVAVIRGELDVAVGPLKPFVEKVQARLGRVLGAPDEAQLMAAVAARGWTVDEAVALLAADADRPALAARLVGVAAAPGFVAHLAVAATPPAALKSGGDGAFRLPPEAAARDRTKIREAVRTALDRLAAGRTREPFSRAAFEASVIRSLGLTDVSKPSPTEFVFGVFDATRDAATDHDRVSKEWESLRGAVRELDERDTDDPELVLAIRRAKERVEALAEQLIEARAEIKFGCDTLGEYGPAAAPALAWLRTAAGDSAAWKEHAASAVERIAAKPAPVPKGAKPPVECVATLDSKKKPLDDQAFTVELKNNADKDIELYSTLPGGVLVFLDVAIEGPDGKRISPSFYDAVISSPFAPPARLIGTIEAEKSLKVELHSLNRYFPKPDEVKPGKYRVRVKFRYKDHTATSEWVPFEVAEK